MTSLGENITQYLSVVTELPAACVGEGYFSISASFSVISLSSKQHHGKSDFPWKSLSRYDTHKSLAELPDDDKDIHVFQFQPMGELCSQLADSSSSTPLSVVCETGSLGNDVGVEL